MKPIDRARQLDSLGLLGPRSSGVKLEDIVRRAKDEFADLFETAPATALLLAAGQVLEIAPDAARELAGYREVLESVERFCGGIFKVSDVRAEFVKGKSIQAGEDDDEGRVVRLRFRLDGQAREVEVTHYADLIDPGFLQEVDAHLAKRKDKRRLCPLLEVMDDTARYLFAEPEKVERAAEQGALNLPDFERL